MPFCRVLLEVAIAEPESTVKDPFRNSVIYNICLDIGVALQNKYMEVSWELCYFGKCLKLPPSYLLSYLPQPTLDVLNNLYVFFSKMNK